MKKTDNVLIDQALPAVLALTSHIAVKVIKKAKQERYNRQNNIYVLKPNKHFTPQ